MCGKFNNSEYWKNTDCFAPFETRAFRFTEDMRPLYLKKLGIGEGCRLLDAGCGTGVFGRYLAAGMKTGHVTGFDINTRFIEYGNTKLRELGLEDKMTIICADGYSLPFPDGSFDAVTNYTYTGVLADPEAGMRELIRVCRPGGVVSAVVASNQFQKIGWQGDYPFDGATELQLLTEREHKIWVSMSQPKELSGWHELRYPKMFAELGLKHIGIYPFSYILNFSDESLPAVYRKQLLITETEENIDWYSARFTENRACYLNNGFTDADFNRMTELMHRKIEYIRNNFDTDMSFEWLGGFNYAVTGVK